MCEGSRSSWSFRPDVSWITTSSSRDLIKPSDSTAHDKSAAARANIVLGRYATVEAYVKANMEG